jgi:D-alanyl-D-alanine carboxypeptidase/D-alanyl-D-alanine-endopeptidase (penicillin-binding protein 4)
MKKLVYRLAFSVGYYKSITFWVLLFTYSLFLTSCSVTKQISQRANTILLKDTAIATGNIGICIYEPETQKYWYNHNATHYFIPASNTKLFTLYAGMKYLGDSLIGGYYQNFSDTAINFIATGDPTFLHSDFKNQPVLDFFKKEKRKIYVSGSYNDEALGYGWAWDDYTSSDMAEKNIFPLHGNVIDIKMDGYKTEEKYYVEPNWKISPRYFESLVPNSYALDAKQKVQIGRGDTINTKTLLQSFDVQRKRASNEFSLVQTKTKFTSLEAPFCVEGINTAITILQKDYGIPITKGFLDDNSLYGGTQDRLVLHSIKTQPTDSLFKLMMHRSDNFFAEQTLIMASKRGWNNLADKDETLVLIDTVLKLHLSKLAQRPKWVDGSGLSRYNLFTPQSFVQILNQLKLEFGLQRLKVILPTGGKGTLKSYYKNYAGSIFAKTGTLSNNCALSGYLITKKGKLLIFSILNNNYITGATPIRKAMEKFLGEIIEKY